MKTPMMVYVIRSRKNTTLMASLHVMTAEKPSGSSKDSRRGFRRLQPQYIMLFKHEVQAMKADLSLQVSKDRNIMVIHNSASAEVDFCLMPCKLACQY